MNPEEWNSLKNPLFHEPLKNPVVPPTNATKMHEWALFWFNFYRYHTQQAIYVLPITLFKRNSFVEYAHDPFFFGASASERQKKLEHWFNPAYIASGMKNVVTGMGVMLTGSGIVDLDTENMQVYETTCTFLKNHIDSESCVIFKSRVGMHIQLLCPDMPPPHTRAHRYTDGAHMLDFLATGVMIVPPTYYDKKERTKHYELIQLPKEHMAVMKWNELLEMVEAIRTKHGSKYKIRGDMGYIAQQIRKRHTQPAPHSYDIAELTVQFRDLLRNAWQVGQRHRLLMAMAGSLKEMGIDLEQTMNILDIAGTEFEYPDWEHHIISTYEHPKPITLKTIRKELEEAFNQGGMT